jgi:class 3 adenylate cyclase
VPRRLVKRLMEEGGSREGVRSMRRTLTLMFTDIAGFTTQSEAMPADQVARFLNEHFALTAACVEAERGTIDKYIGDAMMAFWGAPGHQEDHAERSLRAALAIVRALRDDNARRRSQGQPAIRMRIGLHTGDVVVGNIGSPGRVNYTIVGDAVNVGQRLEQLGNEVMSPQEDVVVLLSEDTMRRVPTGMAPLEPIGERRVKGREQPLKVYRLL